MATLLSSAKADKTYTIKDFIELRSSDEITYYNYSILLYGDFLWKILILKY